MAAYYMQPIGCMSIAVSRRALMRQPATSGVTVLLIAFELFHRPGATIEAMPEIDGYGFGRVTIDGREETRDVIVLPERVVRGWWREKGHGLVLADLDEVLDELPECLLVGTGAYGQMRPDPGTLEALRARGVDVEVLPTAEAVQRYAQLDPRKTAAALHLTC
jgi:hypothetical protein